jgi:ribosomal protein L19
MKVEECTKTLRKRFFFNFGLPKLFVSEQLLLGVHKEKFFPYTGDLVVVSYFDRVPGRFSIFRPFRCYGVCIGSKRSGVTSYFTIRNSFNKNSLELRFFLYSPLIARIVSYDSKRRRYTKAKLYYLRVKKIAKSRFRPEKYRRV